MRQGGYEHGRKETTNSCTLLLLFVLRKIWYVLCASLIALISGTFDLSMKHTFSFATERLLNPSMFSVPCEMNAPSVVRVDFFDISGDLFLDALLPFFTVVLVELLIQMAITITCICYPREFQL